VKYLIGIDEAGRGALAGPVCVGAVLYPEDFDWQAAFSIVTRRGLVVLKDSKQLSAQQRELLYEFIVQNGRLRHAFALVDAKAIDTMGIVSASHEAAAIRAGKSRGTSRRGSAGAGALETAISSTRRRNYSGDSACLHHCQSHPRPAHGRSRSFICGISL
jgi:hypothetical protein